MLPYGRKNPLPFPISQRSHVGNLRQTLYGKGVIHKRVETAGVYPLVRPRGVSATPRRGARRIPALRRAQLPAEVQRKTSRPSGANPPAAVRVPRSAGAEKGCRPEGANTLTQFGHPAQPVLKKGCRPLGANPLTQFASPTDRCQKQRTPKPGQKAAVC